MKLLPVILLACLSGAQAFFNFGQCDENPCENQATCVQVNMSQYFCRCNNSQHYGLRCELKKCQNGNSEIPCETSEICDGPNCPSTHDICEREQPCLNNGICRNTASGFRCECPQGFSGSRCQLVNECDRNPCENFGACSNRPGGFICACMDGFEGDRCERSTDDCAGNLCASGSTCIDGHQSYSCQCPEGMGGRYCNETLACRTPDTCTNGYCLDDKCICDSGWMGDKCNEDINECADSPCGDGACVNKNGSFECVCGEGQTGLLCDLSTCTADRDCFNGGRCLNSKCSCQPGFDGPNCQFKNRDPCVGQECRDNTICVRDDSEINGFSCECPRGFGGHLCTIPTNCSREDKTDSSSCSLSGCSALAGNGVCNQECNHFACGYDGGDCSAGTVPFSRCPDASFCDRHFRDGKCDARCDNENCLFDGFDCGATAPETRRTGTMTEVTLIILVRPETFIRRMDEFLAKLAGRLQTTVTVKKMLGQLDVYEWNSANPEGQRVRFGSRTDARAEYARRARTKRAEAGFDGVLVVILVDLAECSEKCFSDAQSVALFIGAIEAKEPLNPSMPIHSALVERTTPSKERGETTDYTAILIAALFLVAIVAGVAVMVLKRRYVIDAPTWMPPPPPGKDAMREYYAPLGMNGYQGFQSYGEPSAKMPAPVFKSRPEPIAQPASTPLELAAIGEERITPEMCQFAGHPGRFERTPLHWLALNTVKSSSDIESDCIQLLAFGVDPNAQDTDGNTALHYACENARVSLARRMLAAGADPALDNEIDRTPLHVAAKHADDACLEVLLAHKFYKDTTKIDLVDLEDCTALMLYAANSCRSIRGAEVLLKAGADVNYAGDKKRSHFYKGRTALHHAAQSNKDNGNMIEFLVSKNANKDAQDVEEATALWMAVHSDNFVAVDALLKAGASLDFADQKDRTPEGLALERGYKKISERLRVARLRCPIVGLSSYSSFTARPSAIIAPRIIKKPAKKFKSPTPCAQDSTTPSPPGLKASSGPSFLDSPHSDPGRHSANSSSDLGSPLYTPSCSLQPMQPMQQLQPLHPADARPSPPYDTHDPTAFHHHHHQALPPLSLNQTPIDSYNLQYAYQGYSIQPPACAYQQQQQQQQ